MRFMSSARIFSLSFIVLFILASASGFVQPLPSSLCGEKNHYKTPFNIVDKHRGQAKLSKKPSTSVTVLNVSGGANMLEAISSSLKSGPFGIPALTAIATTVLTPLTLYRQAYSFSVGYGYSMAAMGLGLLLSFPGMAEFSLPLKSKSPSFWLTTSLIFYGVRLGSFLVYRNLSVKSKADKFKEMDKTPRLKRIPFVVSVALFYSFLASPAMYASRSGLSNKLVWTGVITAWVGAILEAVADIHKFIIKRDKDQATEFAGPTGGLYALSRHPNYFFEVLYWFGLFLGGVPSFGKNPVAWICSSLGLVGIYSIMSGATTRLDEQQKERYGGQESYDLWRANVPYPLIPLVK